MTSRVWDPIGGATAVDPYFGLPLWLQAPCCGEVLWAVNEAHLTYLYNYIAATLREREPNRNTSTVSRLPTWLKEAKHRDAILSCIARLRQSLAESRAVAPAS